MVRAQMRHRAVDDGHGLTTCSADKTAPSGGHSKPKNLCVLFVEGHGHKDRTIDEVDAVRS